MKISQIELFSVVAIILYMVFFSHSPPYMLRNALGNVFVAGSIFAVLTYVTLYQNQTIGVMLILAFLITMTQVTEHLTQQETSEIQTQITDTRAQISAAQSSTATDKQQRIDALNVQLQRLEGRLNTPPAQQGTTPPAPTNIPVPPPPPASSSTPSCPPGYNFAAGSGFCISTTGGPLVCPNGYKKITDQNGQNPSCVPDTPSATNMGTPPAPIATPATTSAPTAPATPPPAAAAPAPVMSCNIESFAPF